MQTQNIWYSVRQDTCTNTEKGTVGSQRPILELDELAADNENRTWLVVDPLESAVTFDLQPSVYIASSSETRRHLTNVKKHVLRIYRKLCLYEVSIHGGSSFKHPGATPPVQMFAITPQIFLILKRPQAQFDAPKSLTKKLIRRWDTRTWHR